MDLSFSVSGRRRRGSTGQASSSCHEISIIDITFRSSLSRMFARVEYPGTIVVPPPYPACLLSRPNYVSDAPSDELGRYWAVVVAVKTVVRPGVSLYPHMACRHNNRVGRKWWFRVDNVSLECNHPFNRY